MVFITGSANMFGWLPIAMLFAIIFVVCFWLLPMLKLQGLSRLVAALCVAALCILGMMTNGTPLPSVLRCIRIASSFPKTPAAPPVCLLHVETGPACPCTRHDPASVSHEQHAHDEKGKARRKNGPESSPAPSSAKLSGFGIEMLTIVIIISRLEFRRPE